MGKKSTCCEKFRRKGKACSSCPVMQGLSKKSRKKKIARASKRSSS